MAEASPEQLPTTGLTGAAPAPGVTGASGATDPDEDSPNMIVYRKVFGFPLPVSNIANHLQRKLLLKAA
ncbi:hypothetical protein AALO_G00115480 [Alosa alosa]|uniref:Uncharacterized protein n=1 Tax=Alosa alosa TaxID=278164 RepID=A0AAV6GQ59_9TELE|nr:hypothetical protein AALO_G00115480 [Alosa alosa]